MEQTQARETREDLVDRNVWEDFDSFFYGHAARVTRLAALLGASDPEDVAAESFCRLYAARARLRGVNADVVAYLNRIVVNEVRDRGRRTQVARSRVHLVPHQDTTAATEESRVAVMAGLAQLPPRQREALVLRYWLDLPVAGIADAMGIRPGTAKSLVSRGLDALETRIAPTEEER